MEFSRTDEIDAPLRAALQFAGSLQLCVLHAGRLAAAMALIRSTTASSARISKSVVAILDDVHAGFDFAFGKVVADLAGIG